MEVACRRRSEVRDRDISPERTKVWTEPKPRAAEQKVAVIYYLSRNGHLDHPHFMEVSLPSGEGLYLRDVIKRLNSLRGRGMGGSYAWSSKRSYRNGFVWHDLCEDDFIYPAHGNEYILKRSELLDLDSPQDIDLEEVPKSVEDDSGMLLRRKNRPAWGSFDLGVYKVYKKMAAEASVKNADAWTQTEDKRQMNGQSHAIKEEEEEEGEENPVTDELGRDEISPRCSSSSSETLEGLIKADGRIVPVEKDGNVWRRKTRTPAALMS